MEQYRAEQNTSVLQMNFHRSQLAQSSDTNITNGYILPLVIVPAAVDTSMEIENMDIPLIKTEEEDNSYTNAVQNNTELAGSSHSATTTVDWTRSMQPQVLLERYVTSTALRKVSHPLESTPQSTMSKTNSRTNKTPQHAKDTLTCEICYKCCRSQKHLARHTTGHVIDSYMQYTCTLCGRTLPERHLIKRHMYQEHMEHITRYSGSVAQPENESENSKFDSTVPSKNGENLTDNSDSEGSLPASELVETDAGSKPVTEHRSDSVVQKQIGVASYNGQDGNVVRATTCALPASINLRKQNVVDSTVEADATDDEDAVIPCKFCSKSFVGRQNLSSHMKWHKKRLIYVCCVCGIFYNSQQAMSRHCFTAHQLGSRFSAAACIEETLALVSSSSSPHEAATSVEVYRTTLEALQERKDVKTCEVCGKCFVGSKNLASHKLSHKYAAVRSNRRLFSCSECGAIAKGRSLALRHCRMVHGGRGSAVLVETSKTGCSTTRSRNRRKVSHERSQNLRPTCDSKLSMKANGIALSCQQSEFASTNGNHAVANSVHIPPCGVDTDNADLDVTLMCESVVESKICSDNEIDIEGLEDVEIDELRSHVPTIQESQEDSRKTGDTNTSETNSAFSDSDVRSMFLNAGFTRQKPLASSSSMLNCESNMPADKKPSKLATGTNRLLSNSAEIPAADSIKLDLSDEEFCPVAIKRKLTDKARHKSNCRKPQKCPICGKVLSQRCSLRRHINLLHRRLSTAGSKRAFGKQQLALCKKLRSGTQDLFYACGVCGIVYVKYQSADMHCLRTHGYHKVIHVSAEERFHSSSVHGGNLANDSSRDLNDIEPIASDPTLPGHEVNSADGDYVCMYCCLRYDDIKTFRNHVCCGTSQSDFSSSLQCVACVKCGTTFSENASLTSHKETCEGYCKWFPCNRCGSYFLTLMQLETHQSQLCGYRCHKCDTCDTYFRTFSSFVRHMSEKHEMNPHFCPVCGLETDNAVAIQDHIKQAHRFKLLKKKKPKCHICNQVFIRQTLLNQHYRVHAQQATGRTETKAFDRPNICQRVFSERGSLERHNRMIHQRISAVVANQQAATGTLHNSFTESSVHNKNASLRPKSKPDGLKAKGVVHKRECCNGRYACSECGIVYSSYESIERHIQLIHGDYGTTIHADPRPKPKAYQRRKSVGNTDAILDLCNELSKNFIDKKSEMIQEGQTNSKQPAVMHSENYVCKYCSLRCDSIAVFKSHPCFFELHPGRTSDTRSTANTSKNHNNRDTVLAPEKSAFNELCKWFVCQKCGRHFMTASYLETHLRLLCGRMQYKCDLCEAYFGSFSKLKVHLSREHGANPHCCPVCRVQFETADEVKQHIQQLHPKKKDKVYKEKAPRQRPTMCNICGRVLTARFSFKRHFLTVHRALLAESSITVPEEEKLFMCPECPESFAKQWQLNNHSLRHTSEFPHVCDKCGKRFKQHHSLTDHQKVHSDVRPFMCQSCGKSYKCRENLIVHERLHSGVKPFCCDVCGRRFRNKWLLQIHVRIHTGEKPFSCNHCGKKTATQQALRDHIFCMHSGLKPFSCPFCTLHFPVKRAMTRHIKTRHTHKTL